MASSSRRDALAVSGAVQTWVLASHRNQLKQERNKEGGRRRDGERKEREKEREKGGREKKRGR